MAISDVEREKIKNEARKILEDFSAALSKVKIRERKFKKEIAGFREEGNGEKVNDDFRRRMFENAPAKDEDCLIAEKKKW